MFLILIGFIKSEEKIKLDISLNQQDVLLKWSFSDTSQNLTYVAYRSDNGGFDWNPISSFDFRTTKKIKVLNVYPDGDENYVIPKVTFMYDDHTNSGEMHLSASLKVWMEGGSFEFENKTYSFNASGKNPVNNQQFIHVTPISFLDFNFFKFGRNEKYDVIVFGSWDKFGKNFPKYRVVEKVTNYLNLGYGILFTHDVVGYIYGYTEGFGNLADQFGILTAVNPFIKKCQPYQLCIGSILNEFKYYASKVKISKRGLVTNYPYKIEDSQFPIALTHTNNNAAFGDVWMNLYDDKYYLENSGYFTPLLQAESFKYEIPNSLLSEYTYVDPRYYLTTFKNTAMIQIGHSKHLITENERKTLVNVLCYLYQKTSLQYTYDNSFQYALKLNKPTVIKDLYTKTLKLSIKRKEYYYKIIGFTPSGKKQYLSDMTKFDYSTLKIKYLYINDIYDNTNITSVKQADAKISHGTIPVDKYYHFSYVHVAAFASIGTKTIISETKHITLEEFFAKNKPDEPKKVFDWKEQSENKINFEKTYKETTFEPSSPKYKMPPGFLSIVVKWNYISFNYICFDLLYTHSFIPTKIAFVIMVKDDFGF